MKMSRDELKAIVKGLLVELLSEGLGTVGLAEAHAPATGARSGVGGGVREQRPAARRPPAFDPRLDTPVAGGRQPTDALRETIKRESGGNPLMADLLADTAMTTLPAQLAHGDSGAPRSGGAHGPAQQEQFHGAPEEVFGDGAGRWADLAFAEPKKKSA